MKVIHNLVCLAMSGLVCWLMWLRYWKDSVCWKPKIYFCKHKCWNNIKDGIWQRVLLAVCYWLECTKSDIAFAIGNISSILCQCTKHHCISSKRIPMYLKGTLDLWLYYLKSVVGDLIEYCDSDLANDLDGRKSLLGDCGTQLFCSSGEAETDISCSFCSRNWVCCSTHINYLPSQYPSLRSCPQLF